MGRNKKAGTGLEADLRKAKSKSRNLTLRQRLMREALKKAKKSRTGVSVKFVSKQRGNSNRSRDEERTALHPGMRISKNGKLYYENRKNRSDIGRS